ncbi:MAG: hypothetical protein QXU18_15230 [Thermoplasmatales archaeon]
MKKGEIEGILMQIINSQDFKLGLFRVKDIMDIVRRRYPGIEYCSIRNNLDKLVKIGMLTSKREGRNLYFVSTVSREKLSFTIKAISILLEDVDNNKMLRKHTMLMRIINSQSWPLYYVPLRAVGDVDTKFEELQLKASDPNTDEFYTVIVIEDNPTNKRLLIKLRKPLLPSETKDIKIEYLWDEPNRVYTYSSGTEAAAFNLVLASNYNIRVSAVMTSLNDNLSLDVSDKFSNSSSDKWRHIRTLSLVEINPFSMFQFKWQLD